MTTYDININVINQDKLSLRQKSIIYGGTHKWEDFIKFDKNIKFDWKYCIQCKKWIFGEILLFFYREKKESEEDRYKEFEE